MDAGEFRAGNAAGALEFLARFDAIFDVLQPARKASGAIARFRSGAADSRTRGRQESAQLRAGGPDSRGIDRPGHCAGRHQGRRALEEEIALDMHTKAVHAGDRAKAPAQIPVTTPVYTASSYICDSMEELDRVLGREEPGYSYGRYDNPSNAALEEQARALENGFGALACCLGDDGRADGHCGGAGGPPARPSWPPTRCTARRWGC